MYTRNDELDRCFEAVNDGWWNWFVDLKYPKVTSPKYRANRASPEDGFTYWQGELEQEHGANSYIRVIESRDGGDLLFYLLFRDVPTNLQRHWKYRWWQLTAGAAWDRPIDRQLEGLFKYFVFTKRCDIEYCAGGSVTEYRWPEHEWCKHLVTIKPPSCPTKITDCGDPNGPPKPRRRGKKAWLRTVESTTLCAVNG
jgi:hypothetical protein